MATTIENPASRSAVLGVVDHVVPIDSADVERAHRHDLSITPIARVPKIRTS